MLIKSKKPVYHILKIQGQLKKNHNMLWFYLLYTFHFSEN